MRRDFGQKTCEERDDIKDLGVGERMIKWVLKGTDVISLRLVPTNRLVWAL